MYAVQLTVTYWLFLYAASSAAINDLGAQQMTPTPVLQARGASQTAGFISGNPNSLITCPGTSTVRKGPNYEFGCCDEFTCWKPASCQTNDEPICGPNCVYSQFTRCTDEASPSCAKYVLKTSVNQIGGYTRFLCLPSSTVIIVFVTSTGGSGHGPVTTETSGATAGSSTTQMVIELRAEDYYVSGDEGTEVSVGEEPTDTSEPEPTDTSEPEPTDASEPEPTDTSEPEPTDTSEPEPTDASESSPRGTSEPSPGSGGGGGGGYTEDQRIALGVGIGVGVPAVFIPVLAVYLPHLHKKKKRAAASP